MSDADAAREALRSEWHLAVLAGPDTGRCAALGPSPIEVGRGGADLALADARVSRRHLQVQQRRGRVMARDAGSANGTRWRRPRRRLRRKRPTRPRRWTRRLGRRWRVLNERDRLELGATILEVRRRPADVRAPAPPEAEKPKTRRDWIRLALPLVACLGMIPLLLSGSAAPWRWAILAVPLTLALVLIVGRRRRRDGEALPDPAAALLLAATRAVPPAPHEVLRVKLTASAERRPRAGEVVDFVDGDRVALVGPPDSVAATARWLVAQLATCYDVSLDLPPPWRLPENEADWRVTVRTDPLEGRPAGPAPERERPSRPGGRPPRTTHLVLAGRLDRVPTWCTRVVDVPGDGVCDAWARTVAALLAPGEGTTGDRSALPRSVPLPALLPHDGLAAGKLAQTWRSHQEGLAAPLGADEHGTVELDLAEHGPHALIAGTTGSGKSELLLSWMLALALRHSPTDLQFVLVDYKGGATFGTLTDLPHVAGVLTDLDPAATSRALTSLRAEVRRREGLLAAAGAKDLAHYRARERAGRGTGTEHDRLPRLVVVVDEFRALADAHPDVLDALVRLATQGRSLGIHLVLATQRPGGSVGSEVRANLTVRVCLRVLEPAESHDVVGSGAAAELPAVPGRAVVRTDQTRIIQSAWCGSDGWAQHAVEAAREAWHTTAGTAPPPRPWAAPLPGQLPLDELDADADHLPLGQVDRPDEQRLGTWSWRPGALVVAGGAGTGRTETARTVVAAALRAGHPVHVVATEPGRFADLRGPALGTVVGSDDPRRVARLLELLHGPGLLVIDDAEAVADELDAVAGPAQGTSLLARAVRDGRRSGIATVLTGPPSLVGARWLEAVRTRLVLAPRDEAEALVAAVPRDLIGGPAVPGRGVLLEPDGARSVQVARSGPVDLGEPAAAPRLAPLPDRVDAVALRRAEDLVGPAGPDVVTVGLGGDDGGPVRMPAAAGAAVLVVGPPGSGRTTALRTMHRGLTGAVPLGPGAPVPASARAVVADDLDRWAPNHVDDLATAVERHGLTVFAAARSESVAAAYRGPLAQWRAQAALLLLRPGQPITAQLTDVPLTTALDPARPHQPGLAVLVHRGRATPVQVARMPETAP